MVNCTKFLQDSKCMINRLSNASGKTQKYSLRLTDFLIEFVYHTKEYDKKLEMCLNKHSSIAERDPFMGIFGEALISTIKTYREAVNQASTVFLDDIIKPIRAVNEATGKCVKQIYENGLKVIDDLEERRKERNKLKIKVLTLSKKVVEVRAKKKVDEKNGKKLFLKLDEREVGLVEKRTEYHREFNGLTRYINKKWTFFREDFLSSLKLAEFQENARFEIFRSCFSRFIEQTTKLGKDIEEVSQFEVQPIEDLSFQEIILQSLPLSWMEQNVSEKNFEATISEYENRSFIRRDDSNTKMIFTKMIEYRKILDRLESLKVDLYVDMITGVKEIEMKKGLEDVIASKMSYDVTAGYLLFTLNYKIMLYGSQFTVRLNAFESIKRVSQILLKRIIDHSVSWIHVGLLIHISSRIAFQKGNRSREYLIEYMDKFVLSSYPVWKQFFVFRTHRKMAKSTEPRTETPISFSIFSNIGNLSPFKKNRKRLILSPNKQDKSVFGFNSTADAHDDLRRKIHVTKIRKDLHRVGLKEICFYLTLLKINDEEALAILVQLFKEFEVEKTLSRTIYFTHRQYTKAIIANRVDKALHKPREKEVYEKLSGLSSVFVQVSKFLIDDSSYFELLRLNKTIKNDIQVELYGSFLMKNPQINRDDRIKLHYIMLPSKYKNLKIVPTSEIELLQDNKEIIELDLIRTCREPVMKAKIERLLYNYMITFEHSIGYFQGLNFIAYFLVQIHPDESKALGLINYVADFIFIKYFHLDGMKSGARVLSLFHAAERLTEINTPNLYATMQREGVACQQFAAPNLFTLFTVHQIAGTSFDYTIKLWDFFLHRGWHGVFAVFIYCVKTMEHFIKECEMEDLLYFWDNYFKSAEFWDNQEFDKEVLLKFIHPSKVEKLDTRFVYEQLNAIHQNYEDIMVNDEVIELFYEEFLAISQSHKKVLARLNTMASLKSSSSSSDTN